MYLPSTLLYGNSILRNALLLWQLPGKTPPGQDSGAQWAPAAEEGSSMLRVTPGHRAHWSAPWQQHVCAQFVMLETALNTEKISAWDSRCYWIWMKNNSDVYQSNEVFRWNALHQCNPLEFSLFYGQTCKPPLKKSDKLCSSCKWSAPLFAIKASYYFKKLSAMWKLDSNNYSS